MTKSLEKKIASLRWIDYLLEGAELGFFMMIGSAFSTLLYSPSSPVHSLVSSSFLRDALMGVVMGSTASAIIYSPFGKRTGAHFNPAVTIAFYRLGKLSGLNAFFYILAQFIGATVGVLLSAITLGSPFKEMPVHYSTTVPEPGGWFAALITEAALTFILLTMLLFTSHYHKLKPFTGVIAGVLIALFITFALPISGMSINPARTFGSALPAQEWTAFWIYYLAPMLAALAAAELYLRLSKRKPEEICGKLFSNIDTPCPCIDCPCAKMA